jgi:hypothetical protein
MKKEILADRVIVYKNAIPNNEEIIQFLKTTDHWQKWYDVGKQIGIAPNDSELYFDNFPTREEWDSKVSSWKNSHFFQKFPDALDQFKFFDLEEALYNVSADYLSIFPVDNMPNWHRGGVNFLRYDAKQDAEITSEAAGTVEYALPFHTDYHYQTADIPGPKVELTITMYFNDDYEGGDIEYRIYDKQYVHFRIQGTDMIEQSTGKIIPGFNYRPEAGDIIIFPSKLPYWHGVKKVTEGQKLFLRTFWTYLPEEPEVVPEELKNLPKH